MSLRFDVITLFPELVSQVAQWGITERAHREGIYELETWDPRDFTADVHHTVDGRPYGGGPGMVMLYQPLFDALQAARAAAEGDAKVVYMSPQGRPFCQAMAEEYAQEERLILVAGRYEGIDERFIEHCVDEEVSLGDYVVSGGELPAMILMDAVVRLLPGALGHKDSAREDSFVQGVLDCPHYTRPVDIAGKQVPPVLQSGNHAEIAKWRRRKALEKTALKRPDLLKDLELSAEDLEVLKTVR